MSAKKTGQTKNSTSSKKKRTHFPRIEAALGGQPLIETAVEPMTQAASREAAAEITTPERGPGEPAPEAMGVEGPAGDAATTAEATAADATSSEANLALPATDDRVTVPEALTTETLPEASGESPTPQATTEPPTAETTRTEAMTTGMAPEVTSAESTRTAPEGPDMEQKERQPRATKAKSSDGLTKKLSAWTPRPGYWPSRANRWAARS